VDEEHQEKSLEIQKRLTWSWIRGRRDSNIFEQLQRFTWREELFQSKAISSYLCSEWRDPLSCCCAEVVLI